jgi:hypothetical protein
MVVLHDFNARAGDDPRSFWRLHANTLLKCVIIEDIDML